MFLDQDYPWTLCFFKGELKRLNSRKTKLSAYVIEVCSSWLESFGEDRFGELKIIQAKVFSCKFCILKLSRQLKALD